MVLELAGVAAVACFARGLLISIKTMLVPTPPVNCLLRVAIISLLTAQ